jgi:hypothetical protein
LKVPDHSRIGRGRQHTSAVLNSTTWHQQQENEKRATSTKTELVRPATLALLGGPTPRRRHSLRVDGETWAIDRVCGEGPALKSQTKGKENMKSLLITGICVLVCSTVSAVAEPSTPTVYGWPVYTAPSEQVIMSSPVHQNRTVTVRRHKQRPVETAKLPTAGRSTIGYSN